MSLLPRTAEEFSSAEYWERFFRRRGDRAFEWYGDYNSLCGLIHKYIKLQHKVLVVGCGNSELSEQLWDVGYKHLTNIDISGTVVNHMRQRNAERRPGLDFQQVDATDTPYGDTFFQAALDKGTLDAMASQEDGALAGRMLTEVGRVLAAGGRYVCVTLAQEGVVRLAVEHFAALGWAVRLHCLQDGGKEDQGDGDDAFSLPVFVLVCTKFQRPLATPLLELCVGEEGAPARLPHVAGLLAAVREQQAFAVMRKRLRAGLDPAADLSLTLCHAHTGRARYTLAVQDRPPGAKVPRSNHFAIFIVPQGSETSWLYSSPQGRAQLAASANFRRLLVVSMHRNQDYTDMAAIQAELSPAVMDLAPPGMPAHQQVPFLSVGGDLGWREEVSRGVSELSGEYCVENVRGEDGELYRRLVFLSNSALVQSESRLVSANPGSNQKKKKKKSKAAVPAGPPSSPAAPLTVDSGVLCCRHHEVMVSGLALLGVGTSQTAGSEVSVLLVGLGGGGLPQFLRDFVPEVNVEVVELDPAVLDVARRWFGFRPDERLRVTLGDGLDRIRALEEEGVRRFDAVMLDVDSKDPTVGMSCPPAAFVETPVLQKVRNLLTPRGVFMLNLVCRDSALRSRVLERVGSVLPSVLSRRIEGEVNEVLLCSRPAAGPGPAPDLGPAARSLQAALSRSGRRPQLDVAELLKDLTLERSRKDSAGL